MIAMGSHRTAKRSVTNSDETAWRSLKNVDVVVGADEADRLLLVELDVGDRQEQRGDHREERQARRSRSATAR